MLQGRPNVALILAALLLVGVSTGSASASPLGPAASTAKKKSKSPVPALQRKLFSAFAGKTVRAPKTVFDGFRGYPKALGTLDPAHARKLADPRGGSRKPWYLVPGNGAVGLGLPGQQGGAAATNGQACTGRLWVAIPRGGLSFTTATPVSFYGAVTDDITSIVASGGTRQKTPAEPTTARIRHNLLFLDAPDGVALLTFYRGDKTVATVYPVGRPNADRPCDDRSGVPPK